VRNGACLSERRWWQQNESSHVSGRKARSAGWLFLQGAKPQGGQADKPEKSHHHFTKKQVNSSATSTKSRAMTSLPKVITNKLCLGRYEIRRRKYESAIENDHDGAASFYQRKLLRFLLYDGVPYIFYVDEESCRHCRRQQLRRAREH